MPLIDTPQIPYAFPTGQQQQAEAVPDDARQWSFVPTVTAAVRQENMVGSLLSRQTLGLDNSVDPSYDVVKDIQGTKYEQNWESFTDVHNPRYAAAMKQQIDMENDDRRTLAGSGWAGTLLSMGAGIADPSILIPYYGAARKAKGGYSVLKGLLYGAANSALGLGAQEGVLQETQELRSAEQGALNIGFGAVMGGLIGGGAAALLSKAETRAMQKAYDALLESGSRNPMGEGGAAGADVVWRATTDDLTVAGATANRIAAATQFNPVLRSNFRASARVRETAQMLGENTVYQAMHAEGRTLGAAVETLAKMETEAALARAMQAHDDLFANMRKAKVNMSRAEFEDAIGQALRNGDQGVNEFVTQAAKAWRDTVFDPFKQRAIEQGLLPEDVSVETAASYFSRRYHQENLTAKEQEFKDRVTPEIERQMREKYLADLERTNRRMAALDQQLADIKLSPEERAAALDDLERQGEALDAQNADQIEKWTEVVALRQQAKAAKEAGDLPKAAALAKQAKDILDGAGAPLKAYLKARGAIRKRARTVDLNFAGLQDRAQQIQQRLVDLEERNQRSLQRLIARGRVAERKFARLSEDDLAAELDRLEAAFKDTLAQSEKAQQSHVEAITKIREEGRARQVELEKQARDLKARAKDAKANGDLKQPELEQRAYEARVKAAEAKTKAEERIIARIERLAQAEANRGERLRRLNERIDAAKDIDLQAMRDEIQKGIDELVAEVSDKSLSRGERAQRLQERLADLDPEQLKARVATLEQTKRKLEDQFYETWERRHLGEGVGGKEPVFTEYARQVVDEVYDKITGRAVADTGGTLPEYMTTISRGPMKDRTFNVPDAVLVGNKALGETNFLVDNVREVGERYARIMSADIELQRAGMLGKEWNLKVAAIREDYAALREAVANAPDAKAARALIGQRPGLMDSLDAWRKSIGKGEATKERILEFLKKDEQGALEDLHAMRDLVRGTYKAAENATSYAKLTRGLMAYNYLRLMGGVVLANFTEMMRPAMVHGFVPFFREAVKPLAGNLDAMKLSVKEARQAGLVTERVLMHRMMQFGEVADPYARGTGVERLLQNGARFATRWNGLAHWTDAMKSISSILSQNRILDGVAGQGDARFLAYLGIDGEMASRIQKQFTLYGDVQDTIKIANTERWTDDAAVRAYRAAMRKDVDSIIVTRGVGDVPLFANTPTGKMLLQFRSFSLAAHQRVMLRGLQESKARFLGGMVTMTSLGIMASALRAWRNGNESWEKWKTAAENPGYLVGEGLDLTGIFPLAFELANTTEKLTAGSGAGSFNPIKSPMMWAFPDKSQRGSSTRFVSRDPIGAVLGPSAGLPSQVMRAAGIPVFAAQGENPTRGQVKAAQGLVPFGSYLGFKELIQLGTGDSPYAR